MPAVRDEVGRVQEVEHLALQAKPEALAERNRPAEPQVCGAKVQIIRRQLPVDERQPLACTISIDMGQHRGLRCTVTIVAGNSHRTQRGNPIGLSARGNVVGQWRVVARNQG